MTDPERGVPLVGYLNLPEICADLLSDPQFGLKFGAQCEPRHAGVVGNIAMASRTVGEAFKMAGRFRPWSTQLRMAGTSATDLHPSNPAMSIP